MSGQRSSRWNQFLRVRKPFDSLPASILWQMVSRMRSQTFASGDKLIGCGDPGDSLLVILEGLVEIRVAEENGAAHTVDRLGVGEIVGEMALLTNEPRTADVWAIEPVEALVLPRKDFDQIAVRSPLLLTVLSELIGSRLGEHGYDGLYGKTLGGYRLRQRLGRGGMAVVYEAEHLDTGHRVALKMMSHCLIQDVNSYRRFKREADTIRALDHENIVRVYEFFSAFRTYFTAMEFCDGADLGRIVRSRGPLPEDQVRSILGQLARGLHHAHASGIIHRDLTPGNVMVTRTGIVKLMDFGLARPVLDDSVTVGEVVLGTPAYMAPEQFQGSNVDRRADIYAFGLIGCELLVGPRTFPGRRPTTFAELAALVRDWTLPPSDELRPGLSPDIYAMLKASLAREPDDRSVDLERIADWAEDVDPLIIPRSGPSIGGDGAETVTVAP